MEQCHYHYLIGQYPLGIEICEKCVNTLNCWIAAKLKLVSRQMAPPPHGSVLFIRTSDPWQVVNMTGDWCRVLAVYNRKEIIDAKTQYITYMGVITRTKQGMFYIISQFVLIMFYT